MVPEKPNMSFIVQYNTVLDIACKRDLWVQEPDV